MAGLTLYAIGAEMGALDDLLTEVGGELTPELQAWIEEYNLAERTKVDGYGRYAQNQLAEAKACREEADRLLARAKACEGRVDRLKEMAGWYMRARGLTKVQGDTFTVAIQKNGGKPPVEVFLPVEALDPRYVRTTVAIDKEAIRADLEAGTIAPNIARIGEVGSSVRIR